MSVFAEKAKWPQSAVPARAAIPARGIRPSPEVSSVLHPPPFAGGLEPADVAHLDAQGGEMQEERSAALQTGRNPDDPVSSPRDAVRKALREAAANPQQNPEPIIPGDRIQQRHAIPTVDSNELWLLPRIQERMSAVAAETEARERVNVGPRGEVKRTAKALMEYWAVKFGDSVHYILHLRGGGLRGERLRRLRVDEAALVKAAPADLVERIEALRRLHQQRWQEEVDRTADRFAIVASNEAQFATIRQNAKPIAIYGLPEDFEGTVELTDHPDTLVQGKDARPTSPSVVVFMKEMQKQTGTKVLAGNYDRHERYSPHVGNAEEVGKYSFDVDPGAWIKMSSEGFYDREKLVKFFLAVERAASVTQIAWMAFYNDFAVAKEVNETLGKQRIHFSGAGGGAGMEGSIHHGPSPYILHIHFNIMPNALAGQYFIGKEPKPNLDLGSQ
jgi:hypothetical protein